MTTKAYSKYRPSGIEWLGAVPAHWIVAPLKVAFEVRLGKMLQPERSSDGEELAPYLRAANIQWSGVDTSDLKEMWFSPVEMAQLELRRGDLLVSEGGDVGRSAIWELETEGCYFQNSVNRVRPRAAGSTRFLYYWMATIKDKGYVDVLCNKSTIAHFTAEKVQAVPTPLPPLPEQTAIATFLDRETGKIDALVEEQGRLIELLKEKRRAVISHAVTKGLDPNARMKPSGVEWLGDVPEHWEVAQLKRQVNVLPGYAFPSEGFSRDEVDTRLLRGVNVAVGRTRWEDVAYWQRTPDDGLDDFVLQEGDVVLGMDRPWIDEGLRVTRLGGNDLPALLLQRVAAVRPLPGLLPGHLVRLLQGSGFFHHCFPEMTGVSVPHISPTQVGTFVVAIPPVEEQARIEAFLIAETDKMDALVSAAEASVGLLAERRSALISAAVTGKIDVRDTVQKEVAA